MKVFLLLMWMGFAADSLSVCVREQTGAAEQ